MIIKHLFSAFFHFLGKITNTNYRDEIIVCKIVTHSKKYEILSDSFTGYLKEGRIGLILINYTPIMHIDIGKMVEETFRQLKARNRSCNVTWFATQLNCHRRNIYDIFNRPSIDTQLLERISLVLNHNFFQDLSDITENRMKNLRPDCGAGLSFIYPLRKFKIFYEVKYFPLL